MKARENLGCESLLREGARERREDTSRVGSVAFANSTCVKARENLACEWGEEARRGRTRRFVKTGSVAREALCGKHARERSEEAAFFGPVGDGEHDVREHAAERAFERGAEIACGAFRVIGERAAAPGSENE